MRYISHTVSILAHGSVAVADSRRLAFATFFEIRFRQHAIRVSTEIFIFTFSRLHTALRYSLLDSRLSRFPFFFWKVVIIFFPLRFLAVSVWARVCERDLLHDHELSDDCTSSRRF